MIIDEQVQSRLFADELGRMNQPLSMTLCLSRVFALALCFSLLTVLYSAICCWFVTVPSLELPPEAQGFREKEEQSGCILGSKWAQPKVQPIEMGWAINGPICLILFFFLPIIVCASDLVSSSRFGFIVHRACWLSHCGVCGTPVGISLSNLWLFRYGCVMLSSIRRKIRRGVTKIVRCGC